MLCLFNCESDDNTTINNTISYPDNLIAYYPFKANADDLINANNGVVNGALLTEANDAYIFDGVDDAINISHTENLNFQDDFTISALVNTSEIKTQMIIRKGAEVNGVNSSPYYLGMSATNDIVFGIYTNTGDLLHQARKSGYETNTWYLITGVYKDNVMSLYVNGVLEASEVIDGDINLNYSDLLIGTRLNLPSSTFKGIIDEVRLYDSALTEAEISELPMN